MKMLLAFCLVGCWISLTFGATYPCTWEGFFSALTTGGDSSFVGCSNSYIVEYYEQRTFDAKSGVIDATGLKINLYSGYINIPSTVSVTIKNLQIYSGSEQPRINNYGVLTLVNCHIRDVKWVISQYSTLVLQSCAVSYDYREPGSLALPSTIRIIDSWFSIPYYPMFHVNARPSTGLNIEITSSIIIGDLLIRGSTIDPIIAYSSIFQLPEYIRSNGYNLFSSEAALQPYSPSYLTSTDRYSTFPSNCLRGCFVMNDTLSTNVPFDSPLVFKGTYLNGTSSIGSISCKQDGNPLQVQQSSYVPASIALSVTVPYTAGKRDAKITCTYTQPNRVPDTWTFNGNWVPSIIEMLPYNSVISSSTAAILRYQVNSPTIITVSTTILGSPYGVYATARSTFQTGGVGPGTFRVDIRIPSYFENGVVSVRFSFNNGQPPQTVNIKISHPGWLTESESTSQGDKNNVGKIVGGVVGGVALIVVGVVVGFFVKRKWYDARRSGSEEFKSKDGKSVDLELSQDPSMTTSDGQI